MRKAIAVFAVVLLTLGATPAFAACDDGPDYHCLFASCWYDYSEDDSCYSTSGPAYGGTFCFDPGWEFGTGGNAYVTATFTVTDTFNDTFQGFTNVTFNDPNNSANNVIIFGATVYSGSTPTWYPLFVWDGTDGDLACEQFMGGTFYASYGDTVEMSITVSKQHSNATIEASVPFVYTES